MKYIDMHCDTLMQLLSKDPVVAELNDSPIVSVDFKRMEAGDALAQFFAIFMVPRSEFQNQNIPDVTDDEYIEILAKYLRDNLEKYPEKIAQARNAAEIKANQEQGKMSAILTLEDGRAAENSLDKIKHFYDLGIRAIALTWNFENCFGFPNSKNAEEMEKGLKPFGKEAVVYMQDLGILVDVSHLSDGGFYDVADICKKPFVATHSNCRAIAPHQRNLTDVMLKILANAGGVTGINFAPQFLTMDVNAKDSLAKDMAKQARHMANIGGIECIGMGSDLDGITGNLEISDCSKFGILEAALQKEGFSGNEIEKIFWKNTMRVIEDAMK